MMLSKHCSLRVCADFVECLQNFLGEHAMHRTRVFASRTFELWPGESGSELLHAKWHLSVTRYTQCNEVLVPYCPRYKDMLSTGK